MSTADYLGQYAEGWTKDDAEAILFDADEFNANHTRQFRYICRCRR